MLTSSARYAPRADVSISAVATVPDLTRHGGVVPSGRRRAWREMLEGDFDRRRRRYAIALLIGLVVLIPIVIGIVAYRTFYRPAGAVPSPPSREAFVRMVVGAPAATPVPTAVP